MAALPPGVARRKVLIVGAAAFGAVIRAERVRRSIPQDQFALRANIDRSYYVPPAKPLHPA